jgi:hypothetical protein
LTRRCWNAVELEVQMLDPYQGDVGTSDAGMAQALYTRPMPGGGYVRVELVVSDPGDVASERRRGRVVIEPRRASPRRADATPLVVEELEGDDENSVVAELFRIANDNAAIARRVLRRRAEVRRAD